MQEFNLREWKERFNQGEFESGDTKTQIKAGWYDWFCRDTSLKTKTYYMGEIITQLVDSDLIYIYGLKTIVL